VIVYERLPPAATGSVSSTFARLYCGVEFTVAVADACAEVAAPSVMVAVVVSWMRGGSGEATLTANDT